MIISPSQTVITSAWANRFETNVQVLIQDAWARRNKTLMWDKLMMTRESHTGRDILFWLLETAKIVDEGFGGNKRADDLAAMFFEIVNKNSGAMLRLTTNEIRDNQMSDAGLRNMPALDYAASWARQVGGHAAYWPQQALIQLLANGNVNNGYDGVPFFSTAHPVNPFSTGGATFSNRISGFPLSVVASGVYNVAQMVYNFAQIMGTVRKTVQPNGFPRDVAWKYVVGGPDMMLALPLIFETKTFGGGTVSVGPNENIVSRWGIEPLIFPELTETGVCYLVGEALSDEGAAFIFNERDPYVLSSYAPETDSSLQRRKEFEWSFDGRNAAQYGHPYLAVRIEAT
jgi:phage major head subunit gpT-like protein